MPAIAIPIMQAVISGTYKREGKVFGNRPRDSSLTSYTLNSDAGTTVSSASVYAGPVNNGLGSEPLWESESIVNPYGLQVQAQIVSGTLPPLPLGSYYTTVS